MNRRDFMTAGVLAGAAAAVASKSGGQEPASGSKGKFKLKYAPHFGMFKNSAGKDLIDQVKFMADQGFPALEDNGMMRKPIELQRKIAAEMAKREMTMGVFVGYSGGGNTDMVSKADKAYQDSLRKAMKNAVETAKRVNATWCTVVPSSVSLKLEEAYQTANCVENLKVMSEVCEPAGLIMVLEPLNWWTNHPGLFLREIPQAYQICKAVGSPSCKILDDLYHQQIQEGNLIPNMDKAWEEIAYIQVGDNPGRKEPTTGEINYKNIFKHLHQKGFKGVIGMEHGNSKPGIEGEKAVIAAYREVDSF
ncbi:MAG: TIM barrel protein [Kiritimatiellia bacterium]|jgi:hydroxypyruvate isomerase|nr:TIM barrel protein [Kiritimatiellia bacterium]MDP6847333.1 TIM barrel protein [Kiritimatiellia bacterium]